MDQLEIRRIKEIVITGIYSDPYLREKLVLKGANVLDLLYGIASRASMDIDFSLGENLDVAESQEVAKRLESTLRNSFAQNQQYLFDFQFNRRPQNLKPNQPPWWGGYKVSFKIISIGNLDALGNNIDKLRREATIVNPGNKWTFSIDISECEWVEGREKHFMEGVVIQSYSPIMLLCEKIRAICQQMEEYGEFVPNPTRSARARDFFDIYVLCHAFRMDINSPEFGNHLKKIFKAKNVPLSLMRLIRTYRDYHRPDFQSVIDTLNPGESLLEYDEYFDFVCNLFAELEALWVE
jgi:predicted nucleotidyltransferase component of viral defense system